MKDILQDLASFRWWMTVVIAGLLINLFAAYIKPAIDNRIANYSKKKRASIEAKANAHRILIERLRANPKLTDQFRHDEIICRLKMLGFFLMANILMILGASAVQIGSAPKYFGISIIFFGALYLMFGMAEMRASHRKRMIVEESLADDE